MSIELNDIILIKQHFRIVFVLFFIATFHKCMFIGKFASFSLSKCFWGEILSVPFSKIFPNVLPVLLCFVCLCPSGLNQKNRNLFLWQHFSRFAITSGLRMNPFLLLRTPASCICLPRVAAGQIRWPCLHDATFSLHFRFNPHTGPVALLAVLGHL